MMIDIRLAVSLATSLSVWRLATFPITLLYEVPLTGWAGRSCLGDVHKTGYQRSSEINGGIAIIAVGHYYWLIPTDAEAEGTFTQ